MKKWLWEHLFKLEKSELESNRRLVGILEDNRKELQDEVNYLMKVAGVRRVFLCAATAEILAPQDLIPSTNVPDALDLSYLFAEI